MNIPFFKHKKAIDEITLTDFISKTLDDVLHGVADSQFSLSEPGGIDKSSGEIEFDVAVRATKHKTKGSSGKAGIYLLSIEGKSSKGREEETVNRIRFKVWPTHYAPEAYVRKKE